MFRLVRRIGLKIASFFFSVKNSDGDFDSEDAHIRIKPEALDTLCQMTKFTRKELQYMYRGFKQVSSELVT